MPVLILSTSYRFSILLFYEARQIETVVLLFHNLVVYYRWLGICQEGPKMVLCMSAIYLLELMRICWLNILAP